MATITHQAAWVDCAKLGPIAPLIVPPAIAPDHRHPERHPHLAAGRRDRRGDAGLRGGHPSDRGVGDRRVDQPATDPEQEIRGDQVRERGRGGDLRQHQRPRDERHPGHDHRQPQRRACPPDARRSARTRRSSPRSAACTDPRGAARGRGRPAGRACSGTGSRRCSRTRASRSRSRRRTAPSGRSASRAAVRAGAARRGRARPG